MYDVSPQHVGERMTNVHYYHYYYVVDWAQSNN